MNNRSVHVIAFLCAFAGFALFFYKAYRLGFPLTADTDRTVWTIEASLRFDARPGPIKAELKVPALTSGFTTLSENSVSGGYGFNLDYADGGRLARWAVRSADGGGAANVTNGCFFFFRDSFFDLAWTGTRTAPSSSSTSASPSTLRLNSLSSPSSST